jgi:hypothetical protein
MEGFDASQVDDDDELDENDPALEELGFSLAPKTNKEKKKVRSLLVSTCPKPLRRQPASTI